MKKAVFANGEFYHLYNRGNNKRKVFCDQWDLARFYKSMEEFNTKNPIGSIYENSFNKKDQLGGSTSKLVEFVCFCLNPNHYHFLIRQLLNNGIEKFMHRLGTGYTRYFNDKHKTSGALFQGRYKAIHVASNDYLLRLSAYVNLNYKVHQLGGSTSKWTSKLLYKSSWDEYSGKTRGICNKKIILSQFKNFAEYERFANESLVISHGWKDAEKLLLLELEKM